MEAESRQTADETDRPELVSPFYVLLAVPTLLGVAHHVDHIVRGNHVGWPLVAEVNAFTYSLAIYPLIALGLYLTVTDRVGADYWTVLFTGSAGLLAFLHLSPWAVEPPGDVILPYATPVAGYLAFVVLLGLIGSVTLAAVYTAVLWYRGAW